MMLQVDNYKWQFHLVHAYTEVNVMSHSCVNVMCYAHISTRCVCVDEIDDIAHCKCDYTQVDAMRGINRWYNILQFRLQLLHIW